MDTNFKKAHLRIFSHKHEVIGCGFLVAGDKVLTCAHVVADAVAKNQFDISVEEKEPHILRADFPLHENKKKVNLVLDRYDPELDYAILRLEKIEEIPGEAEPARLLVLGGDGHKLRFRAFGFPPITQNDAWVEGSVKESGQWIDGVIKGYNGDKRLQIEGVTDTGIGVGPGFSGGPLVEEKTGRVIGMIAQADPDPTTKTGNAIPIDRVIHAIEDEDLDVAYDDHKKLIERYLQLIATAKPAPDFEYFKQMSSDFQAAVTQLWNTDFAVESRDLTGQAIEPKEIFSYLLERATVSENLSKGVRMVILARIGLGKSPALLSLRRKCAQKEAKKPQFETIPIFIDLGDLVAGQSIKGLIGDQINKVLLRQGAAQQMGVTFENVRDLMADPTIQFLFLLDDIDQLSSRKNDRPLNMIVEFMKEHPRYHFVFTCRPPKYSRPLGPLPTVDLAELTESQAKKIITPIGTHRFVIGNDLQTLGRNRSHMKTILELGHRLNANSEGDTGQAILTRGLLLKSYNLNILEGAVNDSLEREFLEGLLEHLAFQKLVHGWDCFAAVQLRTSINGYIDQWFERRPWRKVFGKLKNSEFLKNGPNRTYMFCDSNAEAYFAASAILHDEEKKEILLDNIDNPRWIPTLHTLIGLKNDPLPLIFDVLDRDVFVAADCLQFAGDPADREILEDAVLDSLLEKLFISSSEGRCEIIRRIGSSSHPRVPTILKMVLKREWSSGVILEICRQLAGHIEQQPFDVDAFEQSDSYTIEQRIQQVLRLLQSYDRPDTLTNSYLKNIISRHEPNPANTSQLFSPLVRSVAAICLGFRSDHTSRRDLLYLLDRKSDRYDDLVAWSIVDSLSLRAEEVLDKEKITLEKSYKKRLGNEEGDPALVDSTNDLPIDKWSDYRCRLIYLFAFLGQDRICEELLDLAMNDPSYYVRGYAYYAIGHLSDLSRLPELESRLKTENESFALRKAAEAVGKIGTSSSIPFLKQHLYNQRARTRWMVRRAIEQIQYRLDGS